MVFTSLVFQFVLLFHIFSKTQDSNVMFLLFRMFSFVKVFSAYSFYIPLHCFLLLPSVVNFRFVLFYRSLFF